MNYIPFAPFIRFIKIIFKNGGLSWSGLLHLPLWLIKTILFEPLRLIEAWMYERKIQHYKIQRSPIFVLGHFRSGTTYLHSLVAQDKRFGWLNLYEQIVPELFLLYERPMIFILQGLANLFKAKNQFYRTPFNFHLVAEEDPALAGLLSEASPYWGYLFPQRFRELYLPYLTLSSSAETNKWEKDYLYLLKKISLKKKNKRLVLKSPCNTARIKALTKLFPNAKFVFISRDPFELFASTKRLWQVILKSHVLGSAKNITIDDYIIKSFKIMMDEYRNGKSLLASHQLCEITYEELLNDPLNTMEKIYKELQLHSFTECRSQIAEFIALQKNFKPLEHHLPFEMKNQICEEWESYIPEHKRI